MPRAAFAYRLKQTWITQTPYPPISPDSRLVRDDTPTRTPHTAISSPMTCRLWGGRADQGTYSRPAQLPPLGFSVHEPMTDDSISEESAERFTPVRDPTDFLSDRVDSSRLVETGGDPETGRRHAGVLIFEDDEHGRWAVGPKNGRTLVSDSISDPIDYTQSDDPQAHRMGEHRWTAETLRRFQLIADDDDVGIAGIGLVAAGCLFPGGSVGVEWLVERDDSAYPDVASHETFPSIGDAIESYSGDATLDVEWTDFPSVPFGSLPE